MRVILQKNVLHPNNKKTNSTMNCLFHEAELSCRLVKTH